MDGCGSQQFDLLPGWRFLHGFFEGQASHGQIGVLGGLGAVQQPFNRQNLDFREIAMMWRTIKTRRVGFRSHGLGGRSQRHQQSDSGFFAIDDRIQFSNHADTHMVAAFNRYDNFLDGIRFVLKETQQPPAKAGGLCFRTESPDTGRRPV